MSYNNSFDSNRLNADAAEAAIRLLVAEYFGKAEISLTPKQIIKLVSTLKPARFETAKRALEKEFQVPLHELPVSILRDHLLGVDVVLPIATKSGKTLLIGIDVTVRPYEVDNKAMKMSETKFSDMLRIAGFSATMAIEVGLTKPYSQLSEAEKKALKKQISSAIKQQKADKKWCSTLYVE